MRFSLLTLIAVTLMISGFVLAAVLPVVGMISAFNETAAQPGGGTPASLADGISDSLFTIVWGVLNFTIGAVLLVLRMLQRRSERRGQQRGARAHSEGDATDV